MVCSIISRTRRCRPASIIHRHKIVRELNRQGAAPGVKVLGRLFEQQDRPTVLPRGHQDRGRRVRQGGGRSAWSGGSDWPHPGLPDNNKPNDALLFDLLIEWAPTRATRNRILVQNPEALYGFGKSA